MTYALRVTKNGETAGWATPSYGVTENLAEALTTRDDLDEGTLAVMGVEMEDNYPQYSVTIAEV